MLEAVSHVAQSSGLIKEIKYLTQVSREGKKGGGSGRGGREKEISFVEKRGRGRGPLSSHSECQARLSHLRRIEKLEKHGFIWGERKGGRSFGNRGRSQAKGRRSPGLSPVWPPIPGKRMN